MRVEIELTDSEFASWSSEACVCGLSLGEWARRRIGAVSVDRAVVAPRAVPPYRPLCQRREAAAPVAAPVPELDADADEAEDVEEEVAVPKAAPGRKLRDLSGKQFGRLTAVELVGRDGSGYCRWRCSCSCGGEKVVATGDLTCGNVKSCGCMRGHGGGRPRQKN